MVDLIVPSQMRNGKLKKKAPSKIWESSYRITDVDYP
jgi:hypothetical protein